MSATQEQIYRDEVKHLTSKVREQRDRVRSLEEVVRQLRVPLQEGEDVDLCTGDIADLEWVRKEMDAIKRIIDGLVDEIQLLAHQIKKLAKEENEKRVIQLGGTQPRPEDEPYL